MNSSTLIRNILVIIFVMLAQVCEGQPSITWQRLYNGPQNTDDYSYGIAESTPGTYFILGQSGSALYLIKINDYGDTIWTRTSPRAASAIASSGDGGCVLASSGYLCKYDMNGNMVWGKNYMFPVGSIPQDIKKTSDGGYVCCSYYGIFDSQVFKTDSAGNLQWHKEFSSTSYLSFLSILEAYNGGYIVGGTDFRQFGDTTRAVLYRLDIDGSVIWNNGYRVLNRHTTGLTLDYNYGKYISAGSTYDSASNSSDKLRSFFYKLDTNGNVTYTKLFSDSSRYCGGFQDLKILNLNRYVFSTIILNGNFCNTDIKAKIFICDSLGNIIVNNIFGASNYVELRKVLPLMGGDIIFSGTLESTLTNWEDIYIVRTDSNLNTSPLNVKNNISSVPGSFKLYQNYPNPFNPTTKIKFLIFKRTKINLVIYDISGKLIFKLITNSEYSGGYYEVEWNAMQFSSGIYFCVMDADDFKQSKKLILLK